MDIDRMLDRMAKMADEYGQSRYDEGYQAGLDEALRLVLKYRAGQADHMDVGYLDGLDDAAVTLRDNGAVDPDEHDRRLEA